MIRQYDSHNLSFIPVRSKVPRKPIKQGRLKKVKGRKFPISKQNEKSLTRVTKKRKSEHRKNNNNSRKQAKQNKTAKLHLKKNSRKIKNKRGKQRKIFRRSKLAKKPIQSKRMVIPVDRHRTHQQFHARHERRQRVNQIKTDRAPTRINHAEYLHKQQQHGNLIDGGQKSRNSVESLRGESTVTSFSLSFSVFSNSSSSGKFSMYTILLCQN